MVSFSSGVKFGFFPTSINAELLMLKAPLSFSTLSLHSNTCYWCRVYVFVLGSCWNICSNIAFSKTVKHSRIETSEPAKCLKPEGGREEAPEHKRMCSGASLPVSWSRKQDTQYIHVRLSAVQSGSVSAGGSRVLWSNIAFFSSNEIIWAVFFLVPDRRLKRKCPI